jgi:hypothetical protein
LDLPELQFFGWECLVNLEPYFEDMLAFMALSKLGEQCTLSLNLGPHTTESHHRHIFSLLGRNSIAIVHLRQANELMQSLFLMHSAGEMLRFHEVIIEPASGLPCTLLLTIPTAAKSLVIRCHLECHKETANTLTWLLEMMDLDSRWTRDNNQELFGDLEEVRLLQVWLDLSFHQHFARRRRMERLKDAIDGPETSDFLHKLRSQGRPVFLSYSIHDAGACDERGMELHSYDH